MGRIIRVAFLSVGLIVTLSVVSLEAQFGGGSGTEDDPWQIGRVYHLDAIRNFTGFQHRDKHFIQTADIDLGLPPWNLNEGWTPIGNSLQGSFQGSYDGNGFAIFNLYINRPSNYQGLFGYVTEAKITNLRIKNADVRGRCCVGIVIGRMNNNVIVSNSYVTGNVIGELEVGGLVGSNWFSIIRNSCYSYENTYINRRNIYTLGAIPDDMFNEWVSNDLTLDINEYLISADGEYLVSNIYDLEKLLYFGQFDLYSYVLTDDIDLWGETNFYIPFFAGTFKGNEKKIQNLNVNLPFISNIGLFGITYGANVTNLEVCNFYLAGYRFIGGLTGHNFSSSYIEGCSSTGYARGFHPTDTRVGGLVGTNRNSSIIRRSFSTADAYGPSRIGGLAGESRQNSIISDCFSRGGAYGEQYVGGLVGFLREYCTITNSFSTGRVQGNRFVGGLVGNNYTSNVIHSYWDALTSNTYLSAGGSARITRQMTFPYDANTFINWNFNDIWAMDIHHEINDGYPYLGWQIFEGLRRPQVYIILNEQEQPMLIWEPIEGANSYRIYTHTDPYVCFSRWRLKAVTDETEYVDETEMGLLKFYRVVASADEM